MFRDKSPSFHDLFKCWGKFCKIITGSCKLLLEIQSITTKKQQPKSLPIETCRQGYVQLLIKLRTVLIDSSQLFFLWRCMMLVKRLIFVEDCNENVVQLV